MGIFKRLLGCENMTIPVQLSWQDAVKIIQIYGNVLETQAPSPGCVADVSKLPFPKAKIKAALIMGLKKTNDQHMREMLKVGYTLLADWQEGVGDTDRGIDILNSDLNSDPVRLVHQVADQGVGNRKWVAIVQTEQDRLKQDLIELGLW